MKAEVNQLMTKVRRLLDEAVHLNLNDLERERKELEGISLTQLFAGDDWSSQETKCKVNMLAALHLFETNSAALKRIKVARQKTEDHER